MNTMTYLMLKEIKRAKYDPTKLFLETYNSDVWSENEESFDTAKKVTKKKKYVDFSEMPPLESDEEVKEENELEKLTPNKLLTRLIILLEKIKSGKNSYKLKNEIRQILFLLHQHNKILKFVYNNLIKSSS